MVGGGGGRGRVPPRGGRGRRRRRGRAGAGGPPPRTRAQDSGFVYYTRYLTGPRPPATLAPPLYPLGSISVLTLVGDSDTWSVTFFGQTGDTPLRALREPTAFDRVLAACPRQAHW